MINFYPDEAFPFWEAKVQNITIRVTRRHVDHPGKWCVWASVFPYWMEFELPEGDYQGGEKEVQQAAREAVNITARRMELVADFMRDQGIELTFLNKEEWTTRTKSSKMKKG